ncbi:Gfo/Idh/MocA family protein [Pendulispora albinea]|uniref:Gfo/Idh/MocA family oxidoreductase n=1 Tax=Pendulispora albinea TaxID=2741071 RepID=A0ABZ2LX91_9BACT
MALIGYGAMGQRHARALLALPERATVTGFYDVRDIDSALPLHSAEAEAIAHADVVFVATPIAAHVSTVLRALRAGRDVFVEKPIGATADEASAMVDAAERSGRRLFVGHSERFNPVVRALHREVRPESILRTTFCRMAAARPSAPSGESRRARARDLLLNLAVHDLDLAAYVTGSRAMVHAAFGREDAADVLLATGRGPAHIRVGREGERERWVLVTTDRATYRGDLLHFRLTVRDTATTREREVPLETEEPLLAQARAVFDALDGKPSEIAEGLDGARAVRLAEKSLALLRKPQPLPQPAEVAEYAGYAGDPAE